MRLGIVNTVVPAEDFEATVSAWAHKLAAKSPVLMRLGKDAMFRSQDMAFADAVEVGRVADVLVRARLAQRHTHPVIGQAEGAEDEQYQLDIRAQLHELRPHAIYSYYPATSIRSCQASSPLDTITSRPAASAARWRPRERHG